MRTRVLVATEGIPVGEYERLAREVLSARHPRLLARLELQGLLGAVLALLEDTGSTLHAGFMQGAGANPHSPPDGLLPMERLRRDSAAARAMVTERLVETIDRMAQGEGHDPDGQESQPQTKNVEPRRAAHDGQAAATRKPGDSGAKEVPGANGPPPSPAPERKLRSSLGRALETLAGEFGVRAAKTDDAKYERVKVAFDAVGSRIRREAKDPDALVRTFVAFLVRQPSVDPGTLRRMYPYLARYAAEKSWQGGGSGAVAPRPGYDGFRSAPPRRIEFAPPGTNPGVAWVFVTPGETLTKQDYWERLRCKVETLVRRAGVPSSSIPVDLSPPLERDDSPAVAAERLLTETALASLLVRESNKVKSWPVRVPSDPLPVKAPLNLANLLYMASELG